jgi:photosystem II stability/assembly factor-like uncharacterized protein
MAIKWTLIPYVAGTPTVFLDSVAKTSISGGGSTLAFSFATGTGGNVLSYDYGVTWAWEEGYGAYPHICVNYAGDVAMLGWSYYGGQGSIWVYKDGGWVEYFDGGAKASLAVSGNGNYLVIGYTSTEIYVSPDTGDNWALKATVPSKAWGCGAANYSGQYMLAGQQSGRLYLSTDYGENWSEVQPAGNADKTWRTANINSDGDKMLVSNEQRLYLSTNYGSTWSEIRPLGDVDKYWSADFDDTGLIMVAGAYSAEGLYVSLDGGTTWTRETPDSTYESAGWGVSISNNGSYIFVGRHGSGGLIPTYPGKGYIGTFRSDVRHLLPLMGAG